LVDAAERSDLAQALRDDTLNLVTCPKCGHQAPAGAPLLFHDPSSRRVYFAVPPGAEEHAWRERAQELLYQLVGSLPEEERRPYLGDVQVEQELAGVRRAVLRRDRRRQADRPPARQDHGATPSDASAPTPPGPPAIAPDDPTPTIEAIRALLAADSDQEFAEIVAANPQLLADGADAIVRQLADSAHAEGERNVAAALRELRVVLADMQAGGGRRVAIGDEQPMPTANLEDRYATRDMQHTALSNAAYQALLRVTSPEGLRAAARDYPALLEEPADADLAARTEAALDEGNERLARAIEAQREALAELRGQLGDPDPLLAAVRAMLDADGEDAAANVISAYPILLTDAAQTALADLAAGARAQGDHSLAEYANSCRSLLRTVRAGLEE
jgi:hypothetical protein